MGRTDRYILSQLLVLFGFFSLVLVSIYWINRAVVLFDTLIGSGYSTLVFLEFTALSLPNVIRMALPLAEFALAISPSTFSNPLRGRIALATEQCSLVLDVVPALVAVGRVTTARGRDPKSTLLGEGGR